MTSTALKDLAANGVSIWLDDLSRERLTSGNLQQLIDDKGVVGVTTNPSIFQAALSEGHAYDAQVRELADAGKTVDEAVFALTTQDVRDACDVFLPVYEATGGQDGRVSIEVDPRLAHDTAGDHRGGQGPGGRGRPPERAHQDPRDGRGPAGHHRGDGGRHLGQRHADLRPRPLPRGDERVPRRAGEGPRERRRPVRPALGGLVLRLPRRHRDRQAARRARHRRGEGAARQGRRRERPAGLPGLRGGLLDPALADPGRRRRPRRSVRCGPRPASRTRPTPTRCTSPSWSRPAPSTRCPRRPSTPPPTTARSPATP